MLHIGENTYREFESLALMDGHYADDIRIFGRARSGRQIAARARDFVYKSYKSAESEISRRLVFFGVIAQQTDIEPAALAVRHRADDSVEARLFAHSADELARAQGQRQSAQGFDLFEEYRRFFVALVSRRGDAAIERLGLARLQAFFRRGAYIRKFARAEAEERREHDSRERYILHWIVEHAQERKYKAYLGGLKESAGLRGENRYAALGERVGINRRNIFCRAQENAEIAVRRGMQSAALCNERFSLSDRAVNISRNIASLRFERIGSVALVRNDMQLTVGSVALGIFSGGVERLGVVIFKLARLRAHQLAEDIVDARCNSHAASEIRAEGYAQGIFSALEAVRCAAAAQEYLRHRLTESVYALLDIADGKKIVLVGGYRPEYHILRFVYILILVDEYLDIMR